MSTDWQASVSFLDHHPLWCKARPRPPTGPRRPPMYTVDRARGGPRGRLNPNSTNLCCLGTFDCKIRVFPVRRASLKTLQQRFQRYNSSGAAAERFLWLGGETSSVSKPGRDCVHYSARGSLAARSGTETLSTFMSLSVYRGRQIKDVSHFRGCKSASGDGSGVSDASNPPSAASTYRLPIHVASKATLQTSPIIKCPQK